MAWFGVIVLSAVASARLSHAINPMNIRQACLDNIGPLTSAARVAAASHGDADHPQQPAPNAPNGGSLEMLNSFSRIRVALTFLDDGLHAVLEIDRR